MEDRTPVLVGAASACQRLDDPGEALEGCDLMAAACEAAAADAGAPGLLRAARLVLVPRGTWPYHDAGRLVAERIGNPEVTTVSGELGVLQTTLIERAATAIVAGDVDVALVVGGEARWREVRASATGTAATAADDTGWAPDLVLRPDGPIVSDVEIAAGLAGWSAVSHYAVIENARRFADGQSVPAHEEAIAELWSRFNAVARDNPEAWHRQPMDPDDIRVPGTGNRPLAWPYNKWHSSQWNVDQAACLILCSAGAARAHGVGTDRWIHPWAIAWSDHAVPVSQRPQLHRSPGFRLALAATGVGADDVGLLDLYSCFPIAVRTQCLELGVDERRDLTVTGGMTFGGGPLNNYVLQSTARLTSRLREAGGLGMVTAVSGMLTKQGVTVWGTSPPPLGYRAVDVTATAATACQPLPVAPDASGPATVVGYTVLPGPPPRAVIVAETVDGRRAVASTTDADAARAMTSAEWCGRTVALDGTGGFAP